MLARFPIILASEYPDPLFRWRLVASTYESARAVIEGAVVLVAMLIVCFVRTGVAGFLWLAGFGTLITLMRLWDRARFRRAALAGDGEKPGTPEGWMKRHTAGALAASAVWGGQDICVLLFTDDPLLQCLVLMTQAGWIAGASVRGAASPAAVLGQLMLSLAPTGVCLCFVPHGLIQIGIPMAPLHIVAMLRISHSLGVLLLKNMESEQRVALMNEQLTVSNERLARLSMIDGLTGIANRRAFDEALTVEWNRAMRDAAPLSLLMIDVDFFKPYNDRYGHQAGDECLRGIGALAAASVRRPTDMTARYGGEEFVILLPGQTNEGACEVAERLRGLIAQAGMPHETAPLGRVSVSIGFASITPIQGQERNSVIHLADLALYEAKRRGRNRVHASSMMAEII